MISVPQAERIIAQIARPLGVVRAPLEKALGSVLQEDVSADRDFPPFDKSLMDGIAIKREAWREGVRFFHMEGIQAAGRPALRLKSTQGCTQIMTGAVLTKGADCVIPIENVTVKNKVAQVNDGVMLPKLGNVRLQGSDCRRGQLLLKKGATIGPPQIAVIAAVGRSSIKVLKKPSVAVVSTGDEVIDLKKQAASYETHASNAYFIKSALQKLYLEKIDLFHARDDRSFLRKIIKGILARYDILILSGGVSMGAMDLVPGVLSSLNVKSLFHKVSQKPGKPFWFGLTPTHKPVFALPGNPVSTQVCTYRYIIPFIKKALGASIDKEYACLMHDLRSPTDLTFFLPVRLRLSSSNFWEAKAIMTGGSGDVAGIGHSDGFMEIPAGRKKIKIGFRGRVYRW